MGFPSSRFWTSFVTFTQCEDWGATFLFSLYSNRDASFSTAYFSNNQSNHLKLMLASLTLLQTERKRLEKCLIRGNLGGPLLSCIISLVCSVCSQHFHFTVKLGMTFVDFGVWSVLDSMDCSLNSFTILEQPHSQNCKTSHKRKTAKKVEVSVKIDQASLGRHKLQQFFLSRTTITNTNWHLIPTILRISHERTEKTYLCCKPGRTTFQK